MKRALRVSVVGHTNTGKTSLLRTLTRDVEFGEVSDRPAVTRDVAGSVLLVDGKPAIELYDTPGLEDSIELLDHLEELRGDRRVDGIDVIRQFLDSPEAHGRFVQEAKAIRQVMNSDLALYVIDARDRVLGKHRDELAILNMCARPIVPVLNFTARPDAQTAVWRDHLSRAGLHAVAEFDTVVLDELSEQRLYEKMRTLLDEHRGVMNALIEDRRQQREELIETSASVIADLLIDVAAFRMTAPVDDPAALKRAMEQLKQRVRDREQQCVTDLLDLHRFRDDDYHASDLPLTEGRWDLDLFDPEALKRFGVRTGSAAAAGAMAGLAIDVAVGGMSLGAATATGATIGALISAGRSHGRRIYDRLRGRSELRVNDATLHLLAARQVTLTRALLTRGHASTEPLEFAADDAPARPPGLPTTLRRARQQPRWSGMSDSAGRSGWIPLSQSGRESAQHELASILVETIRQPRSAPVHLA